MPQCILYLAAFQPNTFSKQLSALKSKAAETRQQAMNAAHRLRKRVVSSSLTIFGRVVKRLRIAERDDVAQVLWRKL